jgi:hypothetical protein
MGLICSSDARKDIISRGISLKELEDAIQKGSKQLRKPDTIISCYMYFNVVFRKIGNNFSIISVGNR